MRGISTNQHCNAIAQCLKTNGIDFVARYYSMTTHQAQKVLKAQEAAALSLAGIQILAVYEDGPTVPEYFSGARGHQDGVNAYHFASGLHQPANSAIYFAVDYDAASATIAGAIKDYFVGVRRGLAEASGTGGTVYDVGVYGSGACCSFLKSHTDFVKFSWLAMSTGWRGSATYSDWNVKQSALDDTLCGLDKDGAEDNETQGAIGAFLIQL